MQRISPPAVRYIKLGPKGRWWKSAFANQRLELGHAQISHELATAGDWENVRKAYESHGKATEFTQEIRSFSELPAGSLWITFVGSELWWSLAGEGTVWLGGDGSKHGVRARALARPWQNTDLSGRLLLKEELHGGLSQTAGYRMSVCKVRETDYLLRRINCESDAVGAAADAAREALFDSITNLTRRLTEKDFELLVDLIFTRSGWRRISRLGATEVDKDLVLMQPVTGERLFVQVKSQASPKVFADYIRRYKESEECTSMVFACHTPSGNWPTSFEDDVHVWSGAKLAAQVLDAGLFDWLLRRGG